LRKFGHGTSHLKFILIEMKYEDVTYKIIACAREVHRKLGPGYPEYIYHRAMAV
jgi:hypothetical protein